MKRFTEIYRRSLIAWMLTAIIIAVAMHAVSGSLLEGS